MGVVDWIFPKECLRCGRLGEELCISCRKTLVPHPELCPACHRRSVGGAVCPACKGKMALEGIVIGFSYEKWLKKLILKLKFYHKKSIGKFLAERGELLVLTHEKLSLALERGTLVVSYVPSHRWRRLIEKGYNQSEILARMLADQLYAPCIGVAKKVRSTASQASLGRGARLNNLKDAFAVEDLSGVAYGSVLVLVDDVTTTGATLNQLAQVIKDARPDLKIWGLVFARHCA